jgi:hypothetical protein
MVYMVYNKFYKKLNNTYIIKIKYNIYKMTETIIVIIVVVIAFAIIIGRKYFNTINFRARVHPI